MEPRQGSRIPEGLEYWSVDVDITQLEVVFLYRFLQVRGLMEQHCHQLFQETGFQGKYYSLSVRGCCDSR